MVDPIDYLCYVIVDVMTYFARLVELELAYVLRMAWYRIRWCTIVCRGWIRRAGIRLKHLGFRVGSRMYWRHIHVWLVISGFQRELTWAEIEELRLQVVARTGVDIPRTPALEAGLRQELGLEA